MRAARLAAASAAASGGALTAMSGPDVDGGLTEGGGASLFDVIA